MLSDKKRQEIERIRSGEQTKCSLVDIEFEDRKSQEYLVLLCDALRSETCLVQSIHFDVDDLLPWVANGADDVLACLADIITYVETSPLLDDFLLRNLPRRIVREADTVRLATIFARFLLAAQNNPNIRKIKANWWPSDLPNAPILNCFMDIFNSKRKSLDWVEVGYEDFYDMRDKGPTVMWCRNRQGDHIWRERKLTLVSHDYDLVDDMVQAINQSMISTSKQQWQQIVVKISPHFATTELLHWLCRDPEDHGECRIQHVHIDQCKFNKAETQALLQGLLKHGTFDSLSMTQCTFALDDHPQEGAVTFKTYLAGSTNIRTLNCSWDYESIPYFDAGLELNTSIVDATIITHDDPPEIRVPDDVSFYCHRNRIVARQMKSIAHAKQVIEDMLVWHLDGSKEYPELSKTCHQISLIYHVLKKDPSLVIIEHKRNHDDLKEDGRDRELKRLKTQNCSLKNQNCSLKTRNAFLESLIGRFQGDEQTRHDWEEAAGLVDVNDLPTGPHPKNSANSKNDCS